MRLLAEEGLGADVSTLGELAFARRAGIEGDRLRRPREQQVGRGAALPPPTRAGSSSSTRSTRWSGRRRPGCGACSSASRPASRRRRTRRSAPGTAARSSGSIRTTRSRRSAARARPGSRSTGCTCTSARSSSTRARTCSRCELLADFAVRCRDELDWTPAIVDLGGGFGVRHVADEPEPPVEQLVGSVAGAVERWWAARGLPAAAADPRAGPRAVAQAGVTLYRVGAVKQAGRAPLRRDRRRHVGQPAAAALRRAVLGPARGAGRRGRDGRLRDRGQALRVGRRADRARLPPRASARRPARRPGHRRVHARDELELQRRAAPGGGARRGRRGAADPPARDRWTTCSRGSPSCPSSLPRMAEPLVEIWSDYI